MELGRIQTLTVKECVQNGYWIGDEEDVAFMPNRLAKDTYTQDQELSLFVYLDRDGQWIATPEVPFGECGEFVALKVADRSPHGVHLAWGLTRDLLLPFATQHYPVEVGETVVVAIDLDDKDRVYASSKLAPFFDRNTSTLKVAQEVELLVYGYNDRGTMVVVNNRFSGLIYQNETFRKLEIGLTLTGYIKELRDDGKVDLQLQRGEGQGRKDAREVIWSRLVEDEFLPLTDKSSPELIATYFQMSKKAFKRAVGGLYRDRMISLSKEGITRVKKERGPK